MNQKPGTTGKKKASQRNFGVFFPGGFFPEKKTVPPSGRTFRCRLGVFPVSVFNERLEPKDESYSMYKSMLEVMVAWVWESQASGWKRERLHGQMGGVVEGGWMSHRYFS